MKKILYSLFVIVTVLSSCVSYKPATGSENKKTITDIPLGGSSDKVDIYFNDDTPKEPFYRVQLLEVRSEVNASYDDLLKKITKQAQDKGFDAILVLDKAVWAEAPSNYYTTKLNKNDYFTSARGTALQQLSAIGIKYKTRMQYVDSIVKTANIQEIATTGKSTYTFDFDFYGNLKSAPDNVAGNFYKTQIAPFDVFQHMHGAMTGWEYENNFGWISSFRFTSNDTTWISAIVAPESTPTFLKVDYVFRDPITFKKSKYTLNCLYEKTGRLSEKKLWKGKQLIWREEMEYNGNKLVGFRRYKVTGDSEELEIQASNSFYSVADLPEAATSVASLK